LVASIVCINASLEFNWIYLHLGIDSWSRFRIFHDNVSIFCLDKCLFNISDFSTKRIIKQKLISQISELRIRKHLTKFMIIETLKTLYARDLNKLKSEIESYKSESAIWKKDSEIPNSAGNLTLHLVGNLNHFIGAEIGKTGYVRQRDVEFSTEFETKADLVKRIDETINVVDSALSTLTDEDLEKEYPIIVFTDKMTTGYFLIHLTTHLSYHLGQINYHRRLLDEN
jgi:uncharacterized damage-inducible protein DinB